MGSIRLWIVGVAFVCLARPSFAAWPFETGDNIFVSPSIADINGDGSLEIVFGSWDGSAYCVDIAGNLVWETPLWDGTGFPPQLHSSPMLADIDGNPSTLETIIGSGSGNAWGRLYCLAAEGNVQATFDTPTQISGSPLVTDLENDGELEIVFGRGSFNTPSGALYCVTVVQYDGRVELVERWSVSYEGGSTYYGQSLDDINGDGVQEILASLSGNFEGRLFCLRADGSVIWDFQVETSPAYGTPAVGNIDGDETLEVIVPTVYDDLHCLDALTGHVEWTFDHAGNSMLNYPAVADVLNDDGILETVLGSYQAGGNGNRLYCSDDAGNEFWQHNFFPEWSAYSSPGIADVDGDGDLEIAIGTGTNPSFGPSQIYLFDHNGDVVWSKIMPSAVYSSPSLADLDGDGNLEIAFGCYDNKFYVLDKDGNTFVPNPDTKPTDLAPWPTYRQNNQRTGYYPGPPKTPSNPADITDDGVVNVDDLLAVINSWGSCPIPSRQAKCPADIAPLKPKRDGVVNVDDLLMVINNWS